MATQQFSILNPSVVPDSTGRCWTEPYDIAASNDVWKHLLWRFADPSSGQTHGIYGQFLIPQNYVQSPLIIPVWTATATSGNCAWRFTYRAIGGDNSESLDQTSNQEQVSLVDAAPGAAHRRLTPTVALTAANLAAGDTVEFLFERNNTSDTMAADALLHDLLFQYADA